jgi:hypothetical protein
MYSHKYIHIRKENTLSAFMHNNAISSAPVRLALRLSRLFCLLVDYTVAIYEDMADSSMLA